MFSFLQPCSMLSKITPFPMNRITQKLFILLHLALRPPAPVTVVHVARVTERKQVENAVNKYRIFFNRPNRFVNPGMVQVIEGRILPLGFLASVTTPIMTLAQIFSLIPVISHVAPRTLAFV